jgi:vacuolar-type H+-ATPase subunit E/Vma4
MEEIVGAQVIQGEILDDARKRAARMLVEAEEEAERTKIAIGEKADAVVAEIMRTSESRSQRFRMETLARLPLETTRMRTEFVDKKLRAALGDYLLGLGEAAIGGLAQAMLARGAAFLSGKAVRLSRRGLSEAAARAIAGSCLAGAGAVEIVEDDSLPAPGLVAAAVDGSLVLRATMDLVEERLLDRSRGELARALCAEALGASALDGPGTATAARGAGASL